MRNKLEMPIFLKNLKTNKLEVNLSLYVLQIIKETETMLKLNLQVPESAQILTYCKQKIIDAFESAKQCVKRNNQLKLSIKPEFIPLMRTQLIELDHQFSPGLSTVTWLAQNLTEYFEQLDVFLSRMERFIKEATDISNARIDEILVNISETVLVFIPAESVAATEFYDLNVKHRQKVEKRLEVKNKSVEKAAVELINMFVEKINVPEYDDRGKRKFQLPAEMITEENRRSEEQKPIDKYDWISFEKLYKPVAYSEGEVHKELCKIDVCFF